MPQSHGCCRPIATNFKKRRIWVINGLFLIFQFFVKKLGSLTNMGGRVLPIAKYNSGWLNDKTVFFGH